ncbi:MAG: SpvB/TcaC N-terminal domain-containing protein, partial [Flavobacteriaceae bacterium]
MNNATLNTNSTTTKKVWFLKATVFTVAFLLLTIIINPTFAQTKETSKQNIEVTELSIVKDEIDKTEISTKETIDENVLVNEVETAEQELSKDQLKQIAELDELLNAEKISQEEYDKRKEEIIGIKPIEPEMMMSKSAMVEPESQTLGKYIAPSVSTSNGSLNYSYPIVVPTGRNGLTPDISLAYNSSNKSQSSIVGTGWSFNIPYIQRTNKTGTNNLYTTDSFT